MGRRKLTHDRATMPDHAFDRIVSGEIMPGMFVVRNRLAVGVAIDEVLLLNELTEQADWNGRVIYLPL
jgi:hypothetical protein